MLKKLQLRCIWTLAHKIFKACSPPLVLSKNVKLGGGGLPNCWEIWTKFQNLTPNISSPKGFGGPILTSGDSWPRGQLKFRNWGPSPSPQFLGNFFSKIWVLQLLPPDSPCKRPQFFSNFACASEVQSTSKITKKIGGLQAGFRAWAPRSDPPPILEISFLT